MNDDASDEWLAAIARISGAGVVMLDASGDLVAADATARRLFGEESLEGLRSRWRAAEPSVARLREQSAAGEGEAVGEVEAGSTPGAPRIVARLLAFDQPRRWLALLRADRDGSSDERVAFARKLGHDLRGPMNAMVLNLDLLRTALAGDEVDETMQAKRARYLGALAREIGRMNDLLGTAVAEVKAKG